MNNYADLNKLENSRNCLRRIARHDELQFSKDSIVNVMERFVKTVNVMDETILVPCRLMDRQVGDSSDIIPAPGKDSTSNQLTLYSSAQGKRGAARSKNVHEFLTSSELFNLYNMLNGLKNDLLWTGQDKDDGSDDEDACGVQSKVHNQKTESEMKTESSKVAAITEVATNNNNNNNSTVNVKGHMRRPSTASVSSSASVSNLSDAESEISNENDSGVEFEGNKSDNAQSSSAGSISSSEDDICAAKAKKALSVDKATELAKRTKRHLNGLYQCLEQMTEAANYLAARYQSDIGPV